MRTRHPTEAEMGAELSTYLHLLLAAAEQPEHAILPGDIAARFQQIERAHGIRRAWREAREIYAHFVEHGELRLPRLGAGRNTHERNADSRT